MASWTFSPSRAVEEDEDDDDRTLVMSARSATTEARFGMMEDEKGEEEELLGNEEGRRALDRKEKLRRDTGDGIEKMRAEQLEEVNFDDEGDNKQALGGTWTIQEEKAVVKKMDRRVVLFVALLYLLSFLDRSNIGNARIAGMEVDLQLSEGQYEWLLTGFYITYIAFEWMALLFRIIPPHIYISIIVLAWGLLASLQSLSSSFTTLLILRATLGASEAAFAGMPFYLSFFFKRAELASRVGVFISAAPLATTFASSLALGITWLGSKFTFWAPWRLLFLVEGFPSVLVAAWVYRSLPDGPESARFLSRRQKGIAQARLVKENDDSSNEKRLSHGKDGGKQRLRLSEIIKALKDPKCYLTAAMFFSCNVAFSSMPVFLPTIIREMGYSTTASQALSVPPYLFSFVTVLLTAYASDNSRTRSPFIVFHALLACSGYILIFLAGFLDLPGWIRYIGVYPATAGFFSCVTLIITWTLNNQYSDEGRGTGVALLQYLGQCGPLLGTRLYPEAEGPLYLKGMAVCAGFMGVVVVLALGLRWVLVKENARIAGGGGAWEELGQDEVSDLELDERGGDEVGKRRREAFVFML
ncbi:polyphosphoinositide phosphatase [Venturia nashicola]|uniref:Polyphosphoinositide phosphatase n=1 Tax=Venturia nashicola TaxID=86259 RepID=A0A4Z1PRG0_9PEZI|nr:polyphosphoinositide phosphatase [Venturia nashicola]